MQSMEKLVSLTKRRGIIFPGSEIYGGLNGTWDLGPVGVKIARKIKNEWLKSIVTSRDDVVELDSSILLNSEVWNASGHIDSFTDPLVECKICHARFREDHTSERKDHEKTHQDKVSWTKSKHFNLMFKTSVGATNEGNKTYLRPETAQGIFINFKNIIDTQRVKIPFGIAQIGKGFRNEITTGNFLFRVREFEMMELEYFVHPEEAITWHEYWKKNRLNWYTNLGIDKNNLKLVNLPENELAHYSKGTSEIHYNWPFMGWGELEGIANRGNYDLKTHEKFSGKDLAFFDQDQKSKYHPYVIEPSVGLGRALLAFLLDSYTEENKRIYLKLHPKLSPFDAAVFPLLANKEQLVNKAEEISSHLKKSHEVILDKRGNIGKRYLSQDEIGTPFTITIDFETLENDTVTVRNRDTTKQERVNTSKLNKYLTDHSSLD